MGILDSAAKGVKSAGSALKNPFSRTPEVSLRGNDFPEGFRFEELTGPKVMVVLAGSAMPKVPFTFGGSQRVIKEHYAGNPEPSLHVLGPEEKDVVIQGRLYDKKLPVQDGVDLYGVATEIQQQIDEVRKRGSLLRIWMGEWQRYGVLVDAEFPMTRLGDIEYKLTFSIAGFTLPRNYQFLETDGTVPLEINSDLINQALVFQQSASSIPDTVPASFADVLNDGISAVATAVGMVTSFVNDVMSTAEDVVGSVNRAVGLVKYAQNEVLRFQRRIGQLSYSFNAAISVNESGTENSNDTAPNQTVARYQAISFIANTLSQATTLSLILAELRKRFEKLATTVPLARHRVVEGDSLQRLSMKFYGTSENWKAIYEHNKLSSTELEPGRILEIPRL